MSAFAIYIDWEFFNDANFHHFTVEIFKFWNCKAYKPLNYSVIHCKFDFYP